jgi:hypothetical protein
MRILDKNGVNRRHREVINDGSHRAIEYCEIINDVLKWIISVEVKINVGVVSQVVYLQVIVLII